MALFFFTLWRLKVTPEFQYVLGTIWRHRSIRQRWREITITEEVVKAAAANRESGKGVMSLLLEQSGPEITITEEALKAAAVEFVGRLKEIRIGQRWGLKAGLKPPFCGLETAGSGLTVDGGGWAGREVCCGGFAGRPGGGGYDMMNSWSFFSRYYWC